jgi:DNA-directed RNA polymerase subunit RPC12/RpoP
MKILKLKCPSCGGTLEKDEKIMYCKYCGQKLLLDDEAKNINFTYRKFDEAQIRENERKERIRLKELENEDKEKERKHKTGNWIMIVWVALIFIVMLYLGWSGKPGVNEIKIHSSAKEYKGDNYKQVVKELKNAGFTDIEVVAQNDLVIGWLTKDASIDRISIDGDTDFSDGDIFSKDTRVVITYHTFKAE